MTHVARQWIARIELKSASVKMARLICPAHMMAFLIIATTPCIESCNKKPGTTTSVTGSQSEIWVHVMAVGKMKIREGQQVMQSIDKIHSIQFRGEDVLIHDDHSIEIPPTINICYSLSEEVEIRYEEKGENRTSKVNLRYRPSINSLQEILTLVNSSICISKQDGSVNLETSVDNLRQIENPLFNKCFTQVHTLFDMMT